MQMNDIINGLNSCDYPQGTPQCNGGGCGISSWIWILLILFYSNQGRGNVCCKESKTCYGTGAGGVGGGYLFLLVILFLCGGCGDGCGQGFDGSFGGIC